MIWNEGFDDFIKEESLIIPVAGSSTETLNACGEAVRPVYQQARVEESGRTAPIPTGDNQHHYHYDLNCPYMSDLGKSFRTVFYSRECYHPC